MSSNSNAPMAQPTLGLGFDAVQAPNGTVFIKVGFTGSGIEASILVPLTGADQFMQQFNAQFAGIVAEVRKTLGGQDAASKLIVPNGKLITPPR